eukprot:2217724-Ditylum_brightwellii.AAC.1
MNTWEEDLKCLDVSTRRQCNRRRSSFFSREGRSLLEVKEEVGEEVEEEVVEEVVETKVLTAMGLERE